MIAGIRRTQIARYLVIPFIMKYVDRQDDTMLTTPEGILSKAACLEVKPNDIMSLDEKEEIVFEEKDMVAEIIK